MSEAFSRQRSFQKPQQAMIHPTVCMLVYLSSVRSSSDRCYLIRDMDCDCRQSMLLCETENQLRQIVLEDTSGTAAYRHIVLKFKLDELDVSPRFFHPLNRLLAIPPEGDPVSVSLTFHEFRYLSLEPKAFDGIFDGIPQNLTKLSIDLYSQRPATVYRDTFRDLSVGFLEISGSTLQSNQPASFEALFNHTSVSRLLSLEGLLLDRWPAEYFQGSINRLLLSKQVQIVSSSEYPKFPVKFYAIGAHNARQIESESFNDYDNLRGLIIHGGNIELSGNKLRGFRHLEELDLDLEKVENATLAEISPTLKLLTLGSRVKHIDGKSIKSLSYNLRQLDIRNIDFNMISYPTRCALADLVNTRRSELTVLIDNEGCECHHLFILMITQIRPLCNQPDYIGYCARYAQCHVVKDYFHELRRLQRDAYSDVLAVNSSYLDQLQQKYRQNSVQSTELRGPAIVVDIGSDEIPWIDTSQSTIPDNKERAPLPPPPHTSLNLIPVVVVCVALIISLAIALLIWNMNYRRRRGQFKPVSCNSAL